MSLDLEKILNTAKNKSSAIKTRAKTIKPNKPQNKYILLPGWEAGNEHVFFHDFGAHYIRNSLEQNAKPIAVYLCLDKTYGKPCPVCDAISQAAAHAHDENSAELLKSAGAGQTYLLNVLELDGNGSPTSLDPQILSVGKVIFGQILDLMEDWGAGIFDANNPQILQINKEGAGMQTKYSTLITSKKIAIDSATVYAKLNNLAEYVAQENEENMQRAIGAVKNVVGIAAPQPIAANAATVVADDTPFDGRTIGGTQPANATVALDTELDDLLGDLED